MYVIGGMQVCRHHLEILGHAQQMRERLSCMAQQAPTLGVRKFRIQIGRTFACWLLVKAVEVNKVGGACPFVTGQYQDL